MTPNGSELGECLLHADYHRMGEACYQRMVVFLLEQMVERGRSRREALEAYHLRWEQCVWP